MKSALAFAAVVSMTAALTGAAEAAKPIRPISLSQVDAPPRAVPGPLAGAGLPALLVLGAYGWRLARRRRGAANGS